MVECYSITSSARCRIDSGIVSLSALAVFRLTANSNKVGCSIGSSPGFAPRRIRATNGAVTQQVQKVEGNTLQVKYKEGEKTIVVPTDAVIVNLVPGDKADLKAGAPVFIPRWEKQADGTWNATVVLVGRDGIAPPM